MFGMGRVGGLNRREYNTCVRDCLEHHIGIVTDSDKNPRFCGILVFADLIAKGWYARRTAEDTAVVIALTYFEGNAKIGGDDAIEADRISIPLNQFWIDAALGGKITEARAIQFREFLDANSWMTRK